MSDSWTRWTQGNILRFITTHFSKMSDSRTRWTHGYILRFITTRFFLYRELDYIRIVVEHEVSFKTQPSCRIRECMRSSY